MSIFLHNQNIISDYKMDNPFISTNHLDTLSTLLNRNKANK